MQDRIFHSLVFGFLGGVLFHSFIFIDFYTILFLILLSFILLLSFSFVVKNKLCILVGIFILAFSFGAMRFHRADISAQKAENTMLSNVGQMTRLSGIVIDEPDLRENNKKLTVEIASITLLDGRPKVLSLSPKVLVTVDFNADIKYGDEIKFAGILEKPKNFVTDYGKEFDYINFLRKDGIFFTMKNPKTEMISSGNGNFIKNRLFSLKNKFIDKLGLVIQSPESLFMGGLILGEKSAFSQAMRDSFVKTGTIHIVALSGYNVTIVAEWIMKLFASLPKNMGIGVGVLTVFLFVIMTGGSSTAIRAGIMASLALVARATGRNYDVARALLVAGVIMILINPFILVYDVSFQLSFIATIAVIFFAPKVEKYFYWVTTSFKLRDIVSVTCAVYIFVMPFILYKMGTFSIVALPANLLILPLISLTMMLGFITGFLGLVSYLLAMPAGWISYVLLPYQLSIISFFSNLSFASFALPNFPLLLTIAIYAYFIYRLFGRNIKKFFNPPG